MNWGSLRRPVPAAPGAGSSPPVPDRNQRPGRRAQDDGGRKAVSDECIDMK